MSEENKALFHRFVNEGVNNKNLRIIGDLMDANYIEHDPAPGVSPGLEGMKEMMGMLFSAFPDLHSTIDTLVAEGDLAAGRMTTTGTHTGDFMGIPATGNKVDFQVIDILAYRDSKATDHWGVTDQLAMLTQLGVVEPPI